MNKRVHIRKLSLELLLSVLAALAVGVFIYAVLRNGLYTVMERRLEDPAFYEEPSRRNADKLRSYVEAYNLAATDAQALARWESETPGTILFLYREDRLVYGAGMLFTAGDETALDPAAERDAPPLKLTIPFRDGPADAVFVFYYDEYYDLLLSGGAALAAFVAAGLVLLLLIHRKTAYIAQLERELKILEGGDLGYAVTVRGEDELAGLARGIDDMRRAIIQRERQEQTARAANHALITAISHDLRSPLTALIGYLDLIREGTCESPRQERRFLEASGNKAYQIKEMTDKLFAYFLVYDTASRPVVLEAVNGRELLDQVVEEGLFDLESRGFQIQREGVCPPCRLQVNADLFRRLFGNLFSNIEKYADPETPVEVRYALEESGLTVCLCNGVAHTDHRIAGTKIGLKTCEKIMADHGGRFLAEKREQVFAVEVWFPVPEEL